MRSIIITLTSNLSVEVSSCLNNLSLNPVKTKILKFSETLILSSWKNLPCYGVVNLTYPIFGGVSYGPFPSLMLTFEMKLSQELLAECKTLLVKMSFICMRIKMHYHINGFALWLTLKQRFGATWKWPITVYYIELSYPEDR